MTSCPLRKPCDWCGKMYGRKLRHPRKLGEAPYYECEQTWRDSQFCSLHCKNMAQGAKAKKVNEQRKAEAEARKEGFEKAIQQFIYGRPQ